jgi:hypothetical protein
MPVYQITFGLDGMGVGWSETHAAKSASEAPADVGPAALLVAQKRVTFLGREFAINSIRISRYSDDGATVRNRGVFLIKQRLTNPVQTAIAAAEPASVALIGAGSTSVALAPAGFAANVNRTFLGAPPDAAVDNAGVVDPGKAGLGAAFAQWVSALSAGNFGWLASATVLNTDIATISQNVNGTVEIVLAQAGFAPLVAGQLYQARIRRVNAGVSPMNGQVIVRATAPNILTTQEIIGLALAQAGGSIRVYQKIKPFIPYLTVVLEGEVGKHKRGRPFGFTPGRARRRIRG